MNPKSNEYIVSKVAEQLGINKENVKGVINHFYSKLKEELSSGNHKSYLLHNLGNIEMDPHVLRYVVQKKKSIQQNPELIERLTEHLTTIRDEIREKRRSATARRVARKEEGTGSDQVGFSEEHCLRED
jgi:nucleoid DNA-binding protein